MSWFPLTECHCSDSRRCAPSRGTAAPGRGRWWWWRPRWRSPWSGGPGPGSAGCGSHRPHHQLSPPTAAALLGTRGVPTYCTFPTFRTKCCCFTLFIAFLPEVGKISGSFLPRSGRAGGHRMPEMDVEMRRAVPIFESANAFTQNHFNL